jgi:serine/threonine protein kinase
MLVDVTESSAAQPGRLLDGRYRLGDVLGSGGAAEVIRAVDERLGRPVAVKLFRGDVADQLQRHEDEMRTLARLAHAGLVTVFDAGTDDETQRPYLVMQLVEGSTLAQQLRRGPLPSLRTAQIGASLADALAYVHGQGLVHRDVKPAHVLIGADARVHLADFGIARIVDSAHVTRTGDVLGTPAYFAPEQVSGELVGPAADVYALGLVLLECLTGRREYDGTSIEVAMARLHRQPEIPNQLPGIWQDLLAGMTAREPAVRVSAEQSA